MSTAAAFRTFLDEARSDLNGGNPQDAERRAKAISALVRAEREVAAYLSELQTADARDDEDALRAELRRRLVLFADADRAGHSSETLERIARAGVGG